MDKVIFTCDIPEEVANYIRLLEFEKNAREDLIINIISTGIDPQSENARFYYDEYIEYAIKVQIAKLEFQNMYIPQELITNDIEWKLIYDSNRLEVKLR